MSAALTCRRMGINRPILVQRTLKMGFRSSSVPLKAFNWTKSFKFRLKRGFHDHSVQGNGLSKSGLSFQNAKEVSTAQMLKTLIAYAWPKDNPDIKKRVLLALGLLVGAKLLNISVPFCFKYAVDRLNALDKEEAGKQAFFIISGLIACYALARAGSARSVRLCGRDVHRVAGRVHRASDQSSGGACR